MVERQLPKLNVAGSIPVSRSNEMNKIAKSELGVWPSLDPISKSLR